MKIKLELSAEMMAVLDQALGSMAYRVAAPVIAEINRQIQAQQAAAQPNVVALPQGEKDTA